MMFYFWDGRFWDIFGKNFGSERIFTELVRA